MEHFNKLTPAEAERLAMLAEECGEVVQIVGKILRHGYDSQHPDGNTAALDRYLAERERHDNCTMCGRPINGDPDMDGHYWTKHARYIDLCDDCGDDEEIER